MLDLSLAVAWLFVLAGGALSVLIGYQMRGPKSLAGVIAAGILACVLGLTLGMGIAYTQTACIEQFHACTSQRDGDLSLWLYAMLAIPMYWLAMLAFAKPADPSSTQAR
jgi:hypothetical protein